jgi:hypothetical protein
MDFVFLCMNHIIGTDRLQVQMRTLEENLEDEDPVRFWVLPYKKNPMFTQIMPILSHCIEIFFETQSSLSLICLTRLLLMAL